MRFDVRCRGREGLEGFEARESERRIRGRETYREGATEMYLSEKHDGSAARTAGAIAFSSLSIKLSTLEKRHRLHALSVAPISNRSAYGFTDMGSLVEAQDEQDVKC
jgi:hypothetical protein